MEAIREYFASFDLFDAAEITDFINAGKTEHLSKGDFFIQEGHTCKKAAFIVSGIFRSFYLSSHAEEVTYCFMFPNNLLAAYSSFITQTPTHENMQALSDAELFTVPKQKMDEWVKTSSNWLLFSKEMAEQQYIELENRIRILQMEKAEVRYEDLLKKNPQFIQQIPLQYLASYLGITQRHLSRLRKISSI